MILKSLVGFVFLLVLFCTLTQLIIPKYQSALHQWQSNSIKAQNFIYTDSDLYDTVMVGSSMAGRLNATGCYNLSFNGLSIYDGLAILGRVKHIPKVIYIETNMLLRKEDKEFTGQLTNPVLYYSKKYIPSLRDGKQPVAMVGSLVQGILDARKKTRKAAPPAHPPVDSALFTKVLDVHVKYYTELPSSGELSTAVENLSSLVKPLEKKGAEIIFFEMPINKKLCQLPKTAAIRNALYRAFPPAAYAYIPQPNCADYQTTDGVHLGVQEADLYLQYFSRWRKNARKKGPEREFRSFPELSLH